MIEKKKFLLKSVFLLTIIGIFLSNFVIADPDLLYLNITPANNSFVNKTYLEIGAISNTTGFINISLYNSSNSLINKSGQAGNNFTANFTNLLNGIYFFNATNFYGGGSCYQESTNTTNQSGNDTPNCGLIYNGTNQCVGSFFNDCGIGFDGVWGGINDNTQPAQNQDVHIYFNYTKPATAFSVVWRVKRGSNTGGYVTQDWIVPSNCFNALSNRVSFDFEMLNQFVGLESEWGRCWNGTGYQQLFTETCASNCDKLYEEAVFWNETSLSISTDTRKIYLLLGNLNIYSNNGSSGLSSFSANVTDLDFGDNYYGSTTTNNVTFLLKKFHNYSVIIDAVGYAYGYQNVTVVNDSQNINISLQKTNSVNITVRNELTLSVIPDRLNLEFSSSSFFANYSFAGGNLFLDNIPEGFYTLNFLDSANYSARTYYLTMLNRTTQSLNAYLLPINQSVSITVIVRSANNDPITGATVMVQRQIAGGSYVNVAVRITDITGTAIFNLEEGVTYRWIVSASGYLARTFDLTPYYANSPYLFKLEDATTSPFGYPLDGVSFFITPLNTSLISGSNTFSLNVISVNANLEFAYVLLPNGTIFNQTGCPSACNPSLSVIFGGSSTSYSVQYGFKTSGFNAYNTNITYYYSNTTFNNVTLIKTLDEFKDELGTAWKTIIAIFLIAVAVILLTQLSGNPTVGTVAGFVGMIFFAVLGWLNFVTVFFMAIIGFIMLYISRSGY